MHGRPALTADPGMPRAAEKCVPPPHGNEPTPRPAQTGRTRPRLPGTPPPIRPAPFDEPRRAHDDGHETTGPAPNAAYPDSCTVCPFNVKGRPSAHLFSPEAIALAAAVAFSRRASPRTQPDSSHEEQFLCGLELILDRLQASSGHLRLLASAGSEVAQPWHFVTALASVARRRELAVWSSIAADGTGVATARIGAGAGALGRLGRRRRPERTPRPLVQSAPR